MGDEPTSLDDPKYEELRKQFVQAKLYRFQPILNAIEDANWGKPISLTINDTKWVFRKFAHAEMTLITTQPYFYKLVAQKPLDEKERQEWFATRKSMTVALCTEPSRWAEFLEKDPGWAEVVFASLMKESSVDVAALDEFFESEYGWNYGFVWFMLMHRTPTEVGAMSEGDYQAINSFFRKNSERMKKPQ